MRRALLEIRLLGRFELRRDGAVVLLPSRPAQSLLAYLTLSVGTAHRREKLAGMLWPDTDDDNARSNLRHALWRIRKAVERDSAVAPYLLSDELAVSFNAGADYWLDAAVLAGTDDSLAHQFDALAAYGGELLPGFYDDWVTLERERLEALFQQKMQRLIGRLVDERRWSDVVEWGERWIAHGHAPEPGYRAVMLAHAELGDRSRAAKVYQRCRAALFDELGVEPTAATRRLYERLRTEEPEPSSAAFAPSTPTQPDEAPAPGEPPFQGLHYFDTGDANRFFGRERLTERLLARLRRESFLAVLGASGSGKSSVVRAGVVPGLSTDGADVHVLTPTARPLDALATILTRTDDPRGPDRAALLGELARDRHGLRRFLEQHGRFPQRTVLVVDQFEEVFTLCRDAFEREAFVENLLGASNATGPARVVVVLRADFYTHCADFAALREAVSLHQEYVGSLTTDELRRAVEGPPEQGCWELEPGLVDLLLRDVGEEPGALPLLSHALLETWRGRRNRRLTLAGYTAAGGIHGGIAQTAETVFSQQLTENQRNLARRVFLQLTELGEGTQDTRRRATVAELSSGANAEADLRAILETLADARLITLSEALVEVAHEALIREWPRLREWLTQDRESLRVHRQLTRAAEDWERLARDPGGLYRSARLSQAQDWAAEHKDELGLAEAAFLTASSRAADHEAAEVETRRQRELEVARQIAEAEHRLADEHRRASSQLRRRAVLLGLALAGAIVMAAAAVFFGDIALQQAGRAQADARAAQARELAAAALTNLNSDPERAALLALRAVGVTHDVDGSSMPEAEDALHRVLPLLRAQLTLTGHRGKVTSIAFSSDGTRVASAGEDGNTIVWDALTGQQQLRLPTQPSAVNAVAFSPDNQLLATATDDHIARVWDASTGTQRLELLGHSREVERLAFDADGSRLATTALDGTVQLWDPISGQQLETLFPNRAGDVTVAVGVAFSPDGNRLGTAVPDGEIAEWDLAHAVPQVTRSWVGYSSRVLPRTIAFSPDGLRLATTTDSGVQVWWAATAQPAVTIVGHAVQILDAAFSPDGNRIATASVDRTAKVWDARSGRELLTLSGHQAPVARVVFSPNGQRLATASWDGAIKIWDVTRAHEVLTISTTASSNRAAFLDLNPYAASNGPGTAVFATSGRLAEGPLLGRIQVSRDGSRLIAGLWDATASVWDSNTGRELVRLRGHGAEVWGAAISPDGARVATGSADHTLRVWDAHTGRVMWIAPPSTDRIVALTFSPDGTRLASAGTDATARLWDVDSGNQSRVLSHPGPLTSLAFSSDGALLVTATERSDDPVRVWDAHSGTLQQSFTGHQDVVWSVSFSPDQTRLVTASRDGTARIWDAVSGHTLLTLQGNAGTLVSAVFSPDGREVAVGGRDGTAQLWDARTGRLELTLPQAETGDAVDSVAFMPDGRQLIVRGDLAVRTYALPVEDVMALARSRLTRTWSKEECQRYLHVEQCPDDLLESTRSTAQPKVVSGQPAPLAKPSALTGAIKLVSSMPRSGSQRAQTDSIVNAYGMALDEHNNRAGSASVVLEDLDDAKPRHRRME